MDTRIKGNNTKIAIIDGIDSPTEGFYAHHKAFSIGGNRKIDSEIIRGIGSGTVPDHATVCAGIAVGEPFEGLAVTNNIISTLNYPGGVAPEAYAKLFLVDLSDPTTLHTAVEKIKEEKYDVVSLSFGSNVENTKFCTELAELKDTIVVAAAGNSGNAVKVASPACLANVISVGCLDVFCKPSLFTADNKFVDTFCYGEVMAPSGPTNQILKWSVGTSMATPAIAGLVCLIIQCAKHQEYYPDIMKKYKIMQLLDKMISKKAGGVFDTSTIQDVLYCAYNRKNYFQDLFPCK